MFRALQLLYFTIPNITLRIVKLWQCGNRRSLETFDPKRSLRES